ncbi:Putative deoxyribonuclease RhsC [BD1-7 clade bacterium]|uniref:Deoxyribonuclease RhsC n=1 Tax=BD1-7 clade bacterium TaxID=2029982 RepID=A0A5S9Q543_9GAMM|nr:Putative deoxyribonuclease RhsC [BD1-7 clade bacterium]CAA0112040.1 Putative deoxyribonuclease RhsC [BD1-7 clade bacterium]
MEMLKLKKNATAIAACIVFVFVPIGLHAESVDPKPNHISLPSGPGSLEGLGKAFEPSLNTGGASYSVSIAVPPGTAGHTPAIALNYSSGFGHGIAGLGWQLSVPSVERSIENGTPRYTDDDVLTYSGETLVPLTDSTYAPALQSQFIRFNRDGNRLIGKDKAGNTFEFGSLVDGDDTLNNRLAVTGPAPDQFNGTFCWYLTKRTDAKGQSTEYFYRQLPGSDGKLFLDRIEYGAAKAAKNRVEFHYETRDDGTADYQAGFTRKTHHRLKTVSVYHGPRALWHYDLSYELDAGDSITQAKEGQALSAGISLLRKVTRFNPGRTASLPPIYFDYTRIFTQDVDNPPLNNFPGVEDVDRNRNGELDAGVLSVMKGLPAGINVLGQEASFTDLTNDGLPDWLYWRSGQYYMARNLGYDSEEGQTANVEFAEPVKVDNTPVAPLSDASVHLIDLDGDGQADILHRLNESRWLYYRNRGDGHFSQRVEYPTPPTIHVGESNVQFMDINMDQRIDIITSNDRYWRYCLNGPVETKAGFAATSYDADFAPFGNFPGPEDIDINGNDEIDLPEWQCSGSIPSTLPAGMNLNNSQIKLADMNGDRIQDIVWLRSYNGKITVQYWPHKGQLQFADAETLYTGAPDAAGIEVPALKLKDINGDGMADLVDVRPGKVRFWLQQYTATGAKWSDTYSLNAPNYARNATTVMDGDINANGTSDFIWVSVAGDFTPQYLDIAGDTKAHLLNMIDNGMGLRTELRFKSTGALQAEADGAGMPWLTSSPLAQQVVASRTYRMPLDTTGNGANDHIVQTYTYRDAWYDPYKKQFRGFRFARVETQGDNAQGTQVSRHFFHTGAPDGQDNDLDGLIDERELDGTTEELPLKGRPHAIEHTAKHIAPADNAVAQPQQLTQAQRSNWKLRRLHTLDTAVASVNGKEVTFVEATQEITDYYEQTGTPKRALKTHTYDDWGNVLVSKDYGLTGYLHDDKTTTNTYAKHANGIFQLPHTSTVVDGNGKQLGATETLYDNLGPGELTRGLATEQKQWKEDSTWVTTQTTRYDAWGNPQVLRDGDGRLRQLIWDNVFHTYPVQEWIFTDNGSGSGPVLKVQADYDTGLGTLTTHTGFNGEQTHLGYDSFGRLLSIQKPYESSPSVNYRYHFVDPFRKLEYRFSAAHGEGKTSNVIDSTSFVYTTLNRDDGRTEEVKQHIDGLGRELATYTRDELGYIVSGSKWFDNQGREVKTFRPWRSATNTYVLPTNDLISTTTQLDAHGRPLREIYPADNLGRRSTMSYLYTPRQLEITDPEGYITRQTVDSEDKVLTESRQFHLDGTEGDLTFQTTTFIYDPLGRLTTYKDAHGNQKFQRFNGLNHKIWQSDLDQGINHYAYDTAGNLLNKTDNLGRKLHYRYDGAGRLKQVLNNTRQLLYAYHYDTPQSEAGISAYKGKLGWVEEFEPASGFNAEEHYHYDLRGNLIHKTRKIADKRYDFHFQYDLQDRLNRQVWPDGDSIDYSYNLRGLIQRIEGVVDNVQYHEDGQITGISYANATDQSRSYDDKGQLTGLVSNGDEQLQALSYRYDLRGNMTHIDDVLATENSQTFRYDATSQLTRATGVYGQLRYRYDAIGNMIGKHANAPGGNTLHDLGNMNYGSTRVGVSDTRNRASKGGQPGPHAITSSGSAEDGNLRTWQYNAVGQRISDGEDADNANHYSWDQLGRMTGWQQKANGTVTGKEVYHYDFKGRRLQKRNYGLNSSSQLVEKKRVTYVDKSYEIRNDTTQKHLFVGNLRVGRLETPIQQALEQIQQYSLGMGWNAVYMKVQPTGSNLRNQLGVLASNATAVVNFDAEKQGYKAFLQGDTSTLANLEQGQVYWLKLTDDNATYPIEWSVTGTPIASEPANVRLLSAGWNQTTLPVAGNTAVSEFVKGTAIERIWYFDQVQQRWAFWQRNGTGTSALQTLTELKPEAIYWVFTAREQLVTAASGINSTRFFLHNNHLGSVALTTDVDGAVEYAAQYQPYGAYVAGSSEGVLGQPYGFSGKEQDGSGLHYFEARFYDSVTGRFVSPDPLFAMELEKCAGSVVECNLYQYVGNGPIKRIDLKGLNATSTVATPPLASGNGNSIPAVLTNIGKATNVYLAALSLSGSTPNDNGEMLTVYRATHYGKEIEAWENTGFIMSEQMRIAYQEQTYFDDPGDVSASAWNKAMGVNSERHSQLLNKYSDTAKLAIALANGDTAQREYPRSTFSVSTDKSVVVNNYMKRPGSRIFMSRLPKSSLIKQTLSTSNESEYLVVGAAPFVETDKSVEGEGSSE